MTGLNNTLITCILFLIIMAGYISWVMERLKISVYLAPCISVTGITAVLYAAGLLNIMTASLWGISAVGIVFFVRYFFGISWIQLLKKEYLNFIFLALITIYVVYYLKGAVYQDGDTMTHWALIAREMYETGRLPNFSTQVVTYQSYPPATACWIWFVSCFTGFDEARSLLAQAGWLFVLAASVFALNKKNKKLYSLPAAAFVFFTLFFGVGIDNLRVDIILPAAFIAGVVLCLAEPQYKNLFYLVLPFLICITTIKNSGILFAVYLSIIYAAFSGNERKAVSERLKRLAASLSVSFVTLYLWTRHTRMVYASPESSRHSLSVSSMQSIFGRRDAEEIQLILTNFLKRWFSRNSSAEWAAFLIFLVVFIAAFRICRKKTITTGICVVIGFAVYKCLLLAMYLVNLPGEDAGRIPAYTRYQGTYTLIVMFASLYLFGQIAGNVKGYRAAAAFTAGLLAFLLLASEGRLQKTVVKPDYADSGCHRKLVSLMEHRQDLQVGQQVIVYTHTPFSWYYVRYTFHNQASLGTDSVDELAAAMENNPQDFEKLIVMDHDKKVDRLLREHDITESGTIVIDLNDRSIR